MMRLMEYLNEQDRSVPVSELADLARREFEVSEVTLRSDLSALARLHGIRKLARGTYEAARDGVPEGLGGGSLFTTRLQHRAQSKIAIAGAVAEVLRAQADLRVLLLDAGTTTYYLADHLSERAGLDLIVWTPSIAAAERLAGARGISVRLLGGELRADYAVVAGDETARALRSLAGPSANGGSGALPQFPGAHSVLDINYLSSEGCLLTDESNERLQKRLMAELGEDLTIVADHSKLFGRRLGLQAHEVSALHELAGKRTLRLVTDAGASEAQQAELRDCLGGLVGRELAVEQRGEAILYTSRRAD